MNCPWLLALDRILLSASAIMINRKAERGSPYLSPLLILKGLVGTPSITNVTKSNSSCVTQIHTPVCTP